MVLASTADTVSIDQLADLADKIMEVATAPSSVCAIQSTHPLQFEVEQLRSEFTRLQDLVRSVSFSNRLKARRSPSPTSSTSDPAGLCWYHHKYGEAAHKINVNLIPQDTHL